MQTQKPVIAIVPVFNPEPGLLDLCRRLMEAFGTVLVVDDGSVEKVADFDRLPPSVIVIRHPVNCGKGAAMKTAMRHVLTTFANAATVVFVDGDGQHRPADVQQVVQKSQETDHVVLGVRDFSKSKIPFRSRFGNVLTSFLVRCLYRIPIYDTQTGLRAFPVRLLPKLLAISGDRYEYEMRLFGAMKQWSEPLEQVSIKTIYIENNRASHFRPIVDSARVYRGLFGDCFLKFIFSSLLGFLTDNIVFSVVLLAVAAVGFSRSSAIMAALIVARLVSASVNYLTNKFFVFQAKTQTGRSCVRYFLLVCFIAVSSYLLTWALSELSNAKGLVITVIKILVETMLFVVSYRIQKRWVFVS